MKKFALIGAAGYVAPRHMLAIKDTGNELVAALDKHDSVGILDHFFPESDFFPEFERFDRHLEKLKRQGKGIHYLSVCSPNYLHDAHIRFGLRTGADVICEKPIVLNPWNIDGLIDMEKETGKRVFTILQLRLHPEIMALRERITSTPAQKKHQVELRYVTARGHWYHSSWKGDVQKSGGITSNIGVHFFDMLIWIFGAVKQSKVIQHDASSAAGELELENATVNWMLSIDAIHLPAEAKAAGRQTFRMLTVDDKAIEFSDGFQDLHTKSYAAILAGNGFGIGENRAVVDLIHQIRSAQPSR